MKYIITLCLVAFSLIGLSQTDTVVNVLDTTIAIDSLDVEQTEIEIKNVSIIIKEKNKKKSIEKVDVNVLGDDDEKEFPNVEFETTIGFGVAGYLQETEKVLSSSPTSTASLDLDYPKSHNYKINGNLFVNFSRNFGLLSGIGLEYNRYVFEENLQVSPKEGYFVEDTVISYGSYKFKTNYIQLPLMLKFQTNNEKFKFAVGGTFSFNIGNKVKFKYSSENVDYKTRIKGNFNVNPIKLSLGARIAFRGIGLYFNYGLTEMNDRTLSTPAGNTNLIPFSAGITLGGL